MNTEKTTPGNPDQGEATRILKSDTTKTILGKALDNLFKAQEHLNAAADHADASVSKVVEAITQNLRGLQREVSQVIYRIDKDGSRR